MLLDEEQRQKIIMHQEGITLSNVGCNGAQLTCEIAQCQMDGTANALIRMQGAEQTAAFVFALSDRVAGGVRDVTDYLPPFLGGEEDDDDDPPPAPVVKQNRVPDFAYGFLCGMAAMAAFTVLVRL